MSNDSHKVREKQALGPHKSCSQNTQGPQIQTAEVAVAQCLLRAANKAPPQRMMRCSPRSIADNDQVLKSAAPVGFQNRTADALDKVLAGRSLGSERAREASTYSKRQHKVSTNLKTQLKILQNCLWTGPQRFKCLIVYVYFNVYFMFSRNHLSNCNIYFPVTLPELLSCMPSAFLYT